jgi:hypothetical protein
VSDNGYQPVTETERAARNGAANGHGPPEVLAGGVADQLARTHGKGAAAEQQQVESSSAAPRQRPPTREEISAAVGQLRTADAGTFRQVEPLARSLTVDRFEEVVETLKARRLSNIVRNDAGYFVRLLGIACEGERQELEATFHQQVAARQPPETKVSSRIERMKRENPEEYARKIAAFEASIGRSVA